VAGGADAGGAVAGGADGAGGNAMAVVVAAAACGQLPGGENCETGVPFKTKGAALGDGPAWKASEALALAKLNATAAGGIGPPSAAVLLAPPPAAVA